MFLSLAMILNQVKKIEAGIISSSILFKVTNNEL